jgi:SMI1 / KNR4 family protein
MAENLKQRGIISEVDKMVLIIDPFGHTEDENIKPLEKRFDIKLPVDYKEFLVTQNGGRNLSYTFENSIKIHQIDEVINIDTMFGINTGIKNADIEQWTEEYRNYIFDHSIIIGDTIQHGFLLFWQSGDDNEGIYYYDDTYQLEASSDENNAYFLAKTFSEFKELIQN